MAAAENISISMDSEALAWVREKAAKEASSVSQVLTEAVQQQRRAEALDALLAEEEVTTEEIVQVITEWRQR